MQYFKLLCMSPLLLPLCITICTTVRKVLDILLVIELLIYSKKYFLIQGNKNNHHQPDWIQYSFLAIQLYSFNLADVEAYNFVSTFCNVVSKLFQRRALTLYQRCATLKIRCRILFHFQCRINIISTLIHNVETTLIPRRNVGWAFTEPYNSYSQKLEHFPNQQVSTGIIPGTPNRSL